MTQLGFIGLGHMGRPMMHNLIRANFDVLAYDVVPTALSAAVDEGAKPAESLQHLVSQSDVIFTSVQTSQQVQDLCLASDGIFNNAKSGLLYIDCSSIDITVARSLHKEARERGIGMLDAPVSGGVAAASAGTLTFMVGGDEKDFKKATSYLTTMGKKIIHAGGDGNGQAAKICNNLLLAISMIGTCEAFNLAEKLGLGHQKFFEISSNASGQCWSMTSYCPAPGILENVPSSHDYQPGFMSKMMLKDLRLAHHAAETAQAPIPMGSLAASLYELFVNEGMGELDFSGIIKLISAKK